MEVSGAHPVDRYRITCLQATFIKCALMGFDNPFWQIIFCKPWLRRLAKHFSPVLQFSTEASLTMNVEKVGPPALGTCCSA